MLTKCRSKKETKIISQANPIEFGAQEGRQLKLGNPMEKSYIYIYMVSSLLPHVAAVHLVLLLFLTDCGVENTAHGPLERCNSSCNSSC